MTHEGVQFAISQAAKDIPHDNFHDFRSVSLLGSLGRAPHPRGTIEGAGSKAVDRGLTVRPLPIRECKDLLTIALRFDVRADRVHDFDYSICKAIVHGIKCYFTS